ncbi:MAG: hypothetical protein WEC84_01380 [Candidatus Andersenbacteria bacterium]
MLETSYDLEPLIMWSLVGAAYGYLTLRRKHWSVQTVGWILGTCLGVGTHLAMASLSWSGVLGYRPILQSTVDWSWWSLIMLIMLFILALCSTLDRRDPFIGSRNRTGIKEFDRK